jgi:hypothetical protein
MAGWQGMARRQGFGGDRLPLAMDGHIDDGGDCEESLAG